MTSPDRSPRAIFVFWVPLSLQWIMMALEHPFLAAIIARLADPTFNLAAYGVAFAFAILVESPVIMLMSASAALVEDLRSYLKMRLFAWALNLLSTLLLLGVLIPGVFRFFTDTLLGIPDHVAVLVYGSLWILLPWPAAIGYRRFVHGILIRAGKTRRVAYGTGVRLGTMAGMGLLLASLELPGAWVGAGALSAGVVVEALAAYLMSRDVIRAIMEDDLDPAVLQRGGRVRGRGKAGATRETPGAPAAAVPETAATSETSAAPDAAATLEAVEPPDTLSPPEIPPSAPRSTRVGEGSARARGSAEVARSGRAPRPVPSVPDGDGFLDFRQITAFYYPLALTSFIGLTTQPILTFFMGTAPAPLESLAVFPVVMALYFLFATFGLSYQEASIALLGRHGEHRAPLGRFAIGLAAAASGGLAILAFTPLARVWFVGISGLSPELASLAFVPAQIVALGPALSVLTGFQRALLVQARRTRPITLATILEVTVIVVLFPLLGWGLGWMGVTAAMAALVLGRLSGVLFLYGRVRKVYG